MTEREIRKRYDALAPDERDRIHRALEIAKETGDATGRFLFAGLDGLFQAEGLRLEERSYSEKEDGGFFIFRDRVASPGTCLRIEMAYHRASPDRNVLAQACIDPLFLKPPYQGTGLTKKLFRHLLLYGDIVHGGEFMIVLGNVANDSWKEYLLDKGAFGLSKSSLGIMGRHWLDHRVPA